MIVNTVAILLALVALSGCAAPPSGTMTPQTGAPQVAAPAAASAEAALDRTVPLPSGATLKVAADWTVTASTDGLILEDQTVRRRRHCPVGGDLERGSRRKRHRAVKRGLRRCGGGSGDLGRARLRSHGAGGRCSAA